ncbi:MAG: hypothetical protein ABIQ55_03015 [Gemmatimonadaceae bacterium]
MTRVHRACAAAIIYGAVMAAGGCNSDSRASKADSATTVDSAAATNAAGTLEGPSADSNAMDSVHPPIGSTEGTIGETRKPVRPIDLGDRPRDSAIAGPYKTIDSVGRIKK